MSQTIISFPQPQAVTLVTGDTLSLQFATPQPIVLQTEGIQGPPGSGGGGAISGDTPTFIQDAAPSHVGAYSWWETTGGNLTLWIEDGL